MSRLLGSSLWSEVRALSASERPRLAAVAYVSSEESVAFGAGDTLITDATDDSVAAGQTRATILQAALRRGARLYSCPNLHAKVMVFGNTAVIGSSNLSAHSANALTEAAWLTNQREAVDAARAFIQGLIPLSWFSVIWKNRPIELASDSSAQESRWLHCTRIGQVGYGFLFSVRVWIGQGRHGDVQPFAEVTGCVVKVLPRRGRPEVQGVARSAALEAMEAVLLKVDGEAAARAGRGTV